MTDLTPNQDTVSSYVTSYTNKKCNVGPLQDERLKLGALYSNDAVATMFVDVTSAVCHDDVAPETKHEPSADKFYKVPYELNRGA